MDGDDTGLVDKKKKYIVSIDKDLFDILVKMQSYVKDISYDSIKPTFRQASKLLAKKIIKRGGIV